MVPEIAENDSFINILPTTSPHPSYTTTHAKKKARKSEAESEKRSTETKSNQKYRYLQHLRTLSERNPFENIPRTHHPQN